jgi:hypothetical protein
MWWAFLDECGDAFFEVIRFRCLGKVANLGIELRAKRRIE